MLDLGAGARELEPEAAADHEDERVNDDQVGEVLGVPVEGLLVAELVNEAVLLQVQIVLEAAHLLEPLHLLREPLQQQLPTWGLGQVLSGFMTGQTDDLVLCNLVMGERRTEGEGTGELGEKEAEMGGSNPQLSPASCDFGSH